jgi:prefoldin subunit 5
MGLTPSIQQIGTALTEMQKNVNDLQKNMGTIKQAKENLTSLVPGGGESIPKDGDSLKKLIPGMGQ